MTHSQTAKFRSECKQEHPQSVPERAAPRRPASYSHVTYGAVPHRAAPRCAVPCQSVGALLSSQRTLSCPPVVFSAPSFESQRYGKMEGKRMRDPSAKQQRTAAIATQRPRCRADEQQATVRMCMCVRVCACPSTRVHICPRVWSGGYVQCARPRARSVRVWNLCAWRLLMVRKHAL